MLYCCLLHHFVILLLVSTTLIHLAAILALHFNVIFSYVEHLLSATMLVIVGDQKYFVP
jgi:hypothetical protein